MSKIQEMRAKREDVKLRCLAILDKASKEGRFLSDDEKQQTDTLQEEMRKWDETIAVEERLEGERGNAPKSEDIPKPTPEKEKRFASFGEQLMAVVNANSGKVDSRLNTRSASGLNETNPADGGFLVQTDFSSELFKSAFETGILSREVKKIPLSQNSKGVRLYGIDESSRANGSRWGGVQSFWESEAEQITATKPKFRIMDLSLKKLTGLCYATDEVLADSVALESVIKTAFAEEFGFKLDDAILNGTGAGMPFGIMNSDALITVSKESSQTEKIKAENIAKMYARMFARSRANAKWYINQELEADLMTLKLGDKPIYIPAGGLSESPYGTLLGRPVVPIEQANAVGSLGDILFADMSQYVMADKGGIEQASSIHVRFLEAEQVFRFILRTDGQPLWNKTITPFKGSTISPFVTLQAR